MAKNKEKEVVKSSKEDRISKIVDKLEKDFGEGTVIGANERSKFHEFISTGSIGLDKALGIGGLPKGRIVEIYGPESSGKTTLAIHIMAEAHKTKDAYCAIVDAEHAFDTGYAENVGVDLKRLKISQPSWGEQALEVVERLAEGGDFDVIVVDSVAALVPKAETEREMGESSMGKQAMLMSQAMRKLTPIAAKSNTLIIFINQIREKIGVMFGSPETTTGGNALKFYSSVRLDIRRSITKDNSVVGTDGETRLGNLTTVKVVKNKTAPPFKKCEFNILYGKGIDKYGELLDTCIEMGEIKKSGAWFTITSNDPAPIQGRDTVIDLISKDKDLYEKLKQIVIESYTPQEFEPPIEEIHEKTIRTSTAVS